VKWSEYVKGTHLFHQQRADLERMVEFCGISAESTECAVEQRLSPAVLRGVLLRDMGVPKTMRPTVAQFSAVRFRARGSSGSRAASHPRRPDLLHALPVVLHKAPCARH